MSGQDTPANLLEFSVHSRQLNDDLVCVAVEGDVDTSTASTLKQILLDLIANGEYHLVIDFTHIGLIDSTGLGVLISAVRRVREHDGRILLVCPSLRIQKLFAITGLNRVFDSFNTVDDLLRKVRTRHWR